MDLVKNKEHCCACGACKSICPEDAISMLKDAYGFLFPQIDHEICIECGACLKVCAFMESDQFEDPISVWAAYSNISRIINKSSSGGIFGTIADSFVARGGSVCGAIYDLDNKEGAIVHHTIADNPAQIEPIRGSKYVHSDAGTIFPEIKARLARDEKVLFSGTPCQCAALKKYLGRDYPGLYLIDIVCHGVPSKQMFQDYMHLLECKFKIKIADASFRNKRHGWGCSFLDVFDENGKVYEIVSKYSSYYSYFLEGRIYRDNCYICPYAQKRRTGDITIADFWGIEDAHPEYIAQRKDNNKGWSCILINTNKGEALLKATGNSITLYPSNYDKCSKNNEQLVHPVSRPKNAKEIMDSYREKGYKAIEHRFFWRKAELFIKGLVPQRVKSALKARMGQH